MKSGSHESFAVDFIIQVGANLENSHLGGRSIGLSRKLTATVNSLSKKQ